MRVSSPENRNHRQTTMAGGAMPGRCPRMHWRLMNPGLPPPESLACHARGPDCCATSAVVDVRRVA